MQANNWVTLARMADNSVGSAEIVNGSIGNADLGTACVKAANIEDGSIGWADISTAVKGAAPDPSFTIMTMQDSLRLMKGAGWNPATDYDMNELDSCMKTLISSYAFTNPCTLHVYANSTRSRGEMAVNWLWNNTHNDSAVYKYELYTSDAQPSYGTGSYVVDLTMLAALRGQMSLRESRTQPGPGGGSVRLSVDGLTYVLVLAWDWHGVIRSSGWDSVTVTSPFDDLGSTNDLIGAAGYTAGMNGMQALKKALEDIATLKAGGGSGSTSGGRTVLWCEAAHSDASLTGMATDPITYSGIDAAKIKLSGVGKRMVGTTSLVLDGWARVKHVNEKGYIAVTIGGSQANFALGGTNTGADTVWTAVSLIAPITAITEGATFSWTVGLQGSTTLDTLQLKQVCASVQ
jgi:hypothetical protein